MSSEQETLVRGFLAAIERRDATAMHAVMADHARVTFPGGVSHTNAASIVAGSRARYLSVGKDIERVDVLAGNSEAGIPDVVYVFGTLSGRFADGTAFAGIRFVDRFEVMGGLIIRHDVWNDVAAYRASSPYTQ